MARLIILIRCFIFILLASSVLPVFAHQNAGFHLQNGDLIFQESCQDEMGEAIKAATQHGNDYEFTHVGMVWIKSPNQIKVIEATEPVVTVTPLADYLNPPNKCTPRSVVGRLKKPYQSLIPKAIHSALQKVGKGYDYSFDIHNDQYYCSELIYQVFKEANHGKPIFPLIAMTFKSKDTNEFPAYWIEHFKKLNIPIPEGQLGNNPADMSRSDLLDIVYQYTD